VGGNLSLWREKRYKHIDCHAHLVTPMGRRPLNQESKYIYITERKSHSRVLSSLFFFSLLFVSFFLRGGGGGSGRGTLLAESKSIKEMFNIFRYALHGSR